MTLNNLGNLARDRHDVAAAQAAYDEAFHIYRRLADANPHLLTCLKSPRRSQQPGNLY